uniref:Uncharacterized protein n=1 Tax=mine drainage metagenome TaxID=410659 RepID=E6QTC7_9ZZZZ
MRFTRAALVDHADFDDDDTGFTLNTLPPVLKLMTHDQGEASWGKSDTQIPIQLGRYELPRRSEEAYIYRLTHSLAQSLIAHAQTQTLQPSKLVLNYLTYGSKVSVIEELRGQSGILMVQKLQVRSLGATEEHVLTAAIDVSGRVHDQDVTERLLNIPGYAEALPRLHGDVSRAYLSNEPAVDEQSALDFATANVAVPAQLEQEISRQRMLILNDLDTRNLGFFAQESEKLDAWADDLKLGLEREIRELDRQIKETRTKSKSAATLAEKLAAQKAQRDLETQRDRKRRELFQRQDEIQIKRDNLIDELENQLHQQIHTQTLFVCEWRLQ